MGGLLPNKSRILSLIRARVPMNTDMSVFMVRMFTNFMLPRREWPMNSGGGEQGRGSSRLAYAAYMDVTHHLMASPYFEAFKVHI